MFRDTEGLGRQVRRLRKKKGWSQQELAQHAGTDARQISRIETAAHEPKLSLLFSVIAALEMDFALVPRRGKAPGTERPRIEDIF